MHRQQPSQKTTPTGRYSPLRYPGGKGKLVKLVRALIRENDLSDGLYVEPYAGGASVAWELLITGVVRRVAINDICRPLHAFWKAALDRTDELCDLIDQAQLNVAEWDRCKLAVMQPDHVDDLTLAYSFFYLNRTNRSGILNGGIIGGRDQTGAWKIDARFNKPELISRIRRIASFKSRITLSCMDAVEFLSQHQSSRRKKTLVYADPPYYEKGRDLYYDFYDHKNHKQIADFMLNLSGINWIVSYDDVQAIHALYDQAACLKYSINYSARNSVRGREIMFFSRGLRIPTVIEPPVLEIDRKSVCFGGGGL